MSSGHKAAATRREGERYRNAIEKAQRSFARAAALLTDPSPDNIGEALFHATRGMIKLAEVDPDGAIADRAETIVKMHRERS